MDGQIPPPDVLKPIATAVVGPIFIGNMLNWLLMGTLIVQVYHYYTTYLGDSWKLQALIYTLFTLDFAQTLMCTQFAWHYAVDIWNQPAELNGIIPWTAGVIPIVGGFVSMTVQIFYAWRIWTLKDNKIMRSLACLIAFVALLQGMSAIIAGFIGSPNTTQQTLLRLHPAFSIWLSGSFIADVLITGCMFYILQTAKNMGPFAQSDTLINKLIANTIQTGALTVIVATVDLALFVRFTDATYHFVPAYILGKLYTNSFIATLNARKTMAGARTSVISSGGGITTTAHSVMGGEEEAMSMDYRPSYNLKRHSTATTSSGMVFSSASHTFVAPSSAGGK